MELAAWCQKTKIASQSMDFSFSMMGGSHGLASTKTKSGLV